ncbi:uncharacterized protein DMAD_05674 [Drosophila madeirensis]|uniref:Uncharacterized protein n=1 Tax=Drosophila madeirensis TaxID=30013 RepID=A0AAU9FMZ8_DROMD
MSKKSNRILKNKASRGQVEDIEMVEQVAIQSTGEFEYRNESEANFYRDYVAKQNRCLQEKKTRENAAEGEKQYCCSFHAELLQKHSKEPPASCFLISLPIWNRDQGPIPPTISTPGFCFNVKHRDNKKFGGVVEVPEILDLYALGKELQKRGYKSKVQLPDFRKMRPGLFHRAMMDEDRPIPEAQQVQATKPQHFKPHWCQENKKTGKKTHTKSIKNKILEKKHR